MLLSSALKLPGPPKDGASEPPRPPVEALPPDPDRPLRDDLGMVSCQLPSAEVPSWLNEERPSPNARCWVDVEAAELCPEAIELHLATGAFYHLSQMFRVSSGFIGVWGRGRGAEQGLDRIWGSVREGGATPQSRVATLGSGDQRATAAAMSSGRDSNEKQRTNRAISAIVECPTWIPV